MKEDRGSSSGFDSEHVDHPSSPEAAQLLIEGGAISVIVPTVLWSDPISPEAERDPVRQKHLAEQVESD